MNRRLATLVALELLLLGVALLTSRGNEENVQNLISELLERIARTLRGIAWLKGTREALADEELMKSLWVVYLVRRRRVGFLVDAAITKLISRIFDTFTK